MANIENELSKFYLIRIKNVVYTSATFRGRLDGKTLRTTLNRLGRFYGLI